MKASILAACVVLAGAGAPAAVAAPMIFSSSLTPEAPGATGSGSVTVTIDTDANTLVVEAAWFGLSGVSTVAHIHCCVAPPGTVGVAVTPGTLPGFPVGVSFGSYVSPVLHTEVPSTYTSTFVTTFGSGTVEGAEAALLAGLLAGQAYFNIHSTTFPSGEIRGFLAFVPEPATIGLLGFGILGLGVARRVRREAA